MTSDRDAALVRFAETVNPKEARVLRSALDSGIVGPQTMTTAVVLGMVALVLLGPAGLLIDEGKWQLRAPRAAIVLWQATGLAGALALMAAGLAVTTASYHLSLAQALVRMADDARRGHPLTGLGG